MTTFFEQQAVLVSFALYAKEISRFSLISLVEKSILHLQILQ